MLKLGEKQTLKILKIKEFGVYMGEDKDQEPVLLPKKQVPPEALWEILLRCLYTGIPVTV